ncbi:hypothetical protein [Nocardia wallacei]|uniref:Rv0361 family membrane protein n=1 Tax=Nocardia wallacei TaxID=480035 RepID=UPI0024557FAB|nr:hypothetical protein [Nocardia wallacei]
MPAQPLPPRTPQQGQQQRPAVPLQGQQHTANSPQQGQQHAPASPQQGQQHAANSPQQVRQRGAASPQQGQQPRAIAPPQHVPPAAAPGAPGGNRKRWLVFAGAAAVVLVVALVAAIVGLSGGGADNSPEGRVKAAVSDYADALDSGDLTELRAATCGPLHDFYQNIAPDQFAGVHKLSVDQKKVPRVDSVDSVEITGDKAVAQASVYTDADPNSRTARTFDLQQTPDGWKVCDPPNAG